MSDGSNAGLHRSQPEGAIRLRRLVDSLPRPIGLAGYGVEGRETLRCLLNNGVSPGDLRVFDRKMGGPEGFSAETDSTLTGVMWQGGEHWPALAACQTVVRSPGLRPDHPALAAAEKAGARMTSATRMFLAACPGPVAGVTGTLGKGTTVSLIGAALQASGIACHLGGNIGTNPLVFLPELEAHTVTVLELSSFQLMDLNGDHPAVAVILRTSTEHLDWHRDVKEYRAAKSRLLSPPTRSQTVIYCADSEGAREIAAFRGAGGLGVSLRGPVAEGLGVAGGHVLRFASGGSSPRPALDRLSLPGAFSLENAGAAQLAAEALGADPARAAAAIAAFTGLPHRLERVGVVRGVTCYNDSYATRPDATLGALASFQEPLAIILGGSEKHADFRELGERLCAHPSLRRIVLIGTTAPRIAGEVAAAAERLGITPPPLHPAPTLDSAFQAALEALPEGGVLLFSPACASFDMFPNYKVRGERFRALVTPPSL